MTKEVESMMCGTNGLGIARDDASFIDGAFQEAGLLSNANQGVGRKMNSMKKIMTAVGAAVLCGAVISANAEVSSNVVGYYGVNDVTQGKGKVSMFSVGFADVSGKDFNFNAGLNVKNVKGTDDSNTSDHILLWDPTKAGGAGGYLTLWYYDDGAGDCGWCDPDGNYIDDPEWSMFKDGFAAGTAFWFEPIDDQEKEITISGAIDGAPYIEPPLAEGKQFSMFSNPFPVQIQLNDADQLVCSGITGTDDSNTSDHLLLWDPTKAGGAGGYLTLWFYDDGAGDSGWCDPDGNYIDDPEWSMFPNGFAPGTAFWFEPYDAKEKTFRFLNPISK